MYLNFLPIGSVVLLKESSKKVMIIGFCQANPENVDKVYDYCGCLYPEGYMDAEKVYLFNDDMIDKVYSVGYMDEEQFAFSEQIGEIMEEIRVSQINEEYGDEADNNTEG